MIAISGQEFPLPLLLVNPYRGGDIGGAGGA